MRDTVVIVPCFNEATRFPAPEFARFAAATPDVAFLFVNDGSTDATQTVLESLASTNPDAFVVHALPRNCGKAEAVRKGMNNAFDAGARFAGYWDADLSTPLDQVLAFRRELLSEPQRVCVMGCRIRRLGAEVHRDPVRHYLGRVFATLASLVLRLGVYDTQCGAKLFRVCEETKALVAEPFSSRWIFDVEILARLYARRRHRGESLDDAVVEYPLHQWKDVEGSKLRGWHMLGALLDLARIGKRYR